MANSNDAFLEVLKSWLVKKLGYLVDESMPVKLYKVRTCSDIDMICIHPAKKRISVEFLEKPLSRRLLIESKGWLADYPVMPCLKYDFSLLKRMNGMVIPKEYSKRRHAYTFVVLKEEVFEKGKEFFGTDNFDRVIVVRNLMEEAKQEEIEKLKNRYRTKGVVIIEIHKILSDLLRYIANLDKKNNKNKDGQSEGKALLRKDLVLGVLNLVYKYRENIRENEK